MVLEHLDIYRKIVDLNVKHKMIKPLEQNSVKLLELNNQGGVIKHDTRIMIYKRNQYISYCQN
jgi:hypothetical protein